MADHSLGPAAAPRPAQYASASAASSPSPYHPRPGDLIPNALAAISAPDADANLTSMVRLAVQAEVKQMISEVLIEMANNLRLPTKPSAVELQVSRRIKDLEVQLQESEQKILLLQQEVGTLKPGQIIAHGSSPLPIMLQQAHTVMQSALVGCAEKVNGQVKLFRAPGIYIRISSISTFIRQLCSCFFSDFQTASFGVDAPTFQRPDKDQKLRLFSEYQRYSAEDASTLFDTNQGLFHSFCLSKFQILTYNDNDSTPFTNPEQRSSVLHDLLLSRHSSPLFTDFIELAKTVWLLHKLAFAFNPIAEIFSVNAGEPYNPQYMEVRHGITGDLKKYRDGEPITGNLITVPGFTVQHCIIKAQVLHFHGKET